MSAPARLKPGRGYCRRSTRLLDLDDLAALLVAASGGKGLAARARNANGILLMRMPGPDGIAFAREVAFENNRIALCLSIRGAVVRLPAINKGTPREDMTMLRPSSSPAILVLALLLTLGLGGASFAQAPSPPPLPPPGPSPAQPAQLISTAEARAIIEGAVAYAREKNVRMGVVVLDTSGDIVAGERMDGASGRNVHFAVGKAYASVMYRTTTQALSELYKTRPDRYFGIMNQYGDKVYLVGGGVPIALDGKLIGAVGVAGLAEFEDERASRAGLAAWEKVRTTLRK